jgi:tetratricopeptide (TPR) repeat protein
MSRVGKRLGALVAGPLFVGLAACGTPQTPAQTATNLVTQGLKAQLAGDLATAAHDYQQAIQTDANNTVSHYDLGTIYDQQGNVAKAVGEYQATLVINPTFTDAVFNLAVDTAKSDPSTAEQLYFKVIAQQPTFAAAWLNLGFILQGQGQTAQARADWAKAIALDSSLASRIPSPSPSPARGAPPSPTPKH